MFWMQNIGIEMLGMSISFQLHHGQKQKQILQYICLY